MMQPQVLDLDASVAALHNEARYDFRAWCERLRFACSVRTLRQFGDAVAAVLPPAHGPVFVGSGDFHHLSLALIARAAAAQRAPIDVLVLDNHPDNMRLPWGVHCGSWVSRVAALPNVACVDVAGITSDDIALGHAWENRLLPLARGRVRYWSIGVDVRWARRVGLSHAFIDFDSAEAMVDALRDHIAGSAAPLYLSIDKDVLDARDAHTNWDQGVLRLPQLLELAATTRDRVVGVDVTGEVSIARYAQRWKRMLSSLDAQPTPEPSELAQWQADQQRINARLLEALSGSAVA